MRINNYDDFYKSKNSNVRIILGCVASLFAITAILGIVLAANQDKMKKHKTTETESVVEVVSEDEEIIEEKDRSNLTSDDLDFWQMYDEEPKDYSDAPLKNSNSDKYDKFEERAENERRLQEQEEKGEPSANSISKNTVSGNTFNAADSGPAEEVEINESLPKCAYIADGFRQENEELQYYSANRKISSFGIDVSKYQGEIDWQKVKEAGVDFAMIRMGVRGYSSGSVVIDEQFVKNIEDATANGIDVGIYFYSQAVTEQEAIEEAYYAVAAVANYSLTYPIVFHTEEIINDTARTDSVSPSQMSANAKAFCDTVKAYGYKAMIAGSKHQLATRLDLTTLSGYDLWLLDAQVAAEGQRLRMSDFPYQYTMWQYSSAGSIEGVTGSVDLNISFVDYKYR